MQLLYWFRPLIAGLLTIGLIAACSSSSTEVDDSPPVEEVDEERSLLEFEALSGEHRQQHGDEELGGQRVSELSDDVLVLYGVDSITPTEAAELADYQGGAIFFVDLEELDAQSGAALAGFGDKTARMEFYGLEGLEPTAAAALVGWAGARIGLDGLDELDVETAQAIGEWYVERLALNGLTELDADVAAEIIRAPRTELELNGVESIDVEVATALANWRGDVLELNGLTSLDDGVVEVLRDFDGTVQASPELRDALGADRE